MSAGKIIFAILSFCLGFYLGCVIKGGISFWAIVPASLFCSAALWICDKNSDDPKEEDDNSSKDK